MTLQLADYADCLQDASAEMRAVLESSFQEASRVMSAQGLQRYLEGVRALCSLGRGNDVVITYLQEMPLVAKEVGEDVVEDCFHQALKLSSMTSGAVIALFFQSLPTAARRLGDPELVRGYLGFIHQLSARAARGLRPMLGRIDELLSKLTLSGLRRWAFYGAEAYRRDLPKLTKYFALETTDSVSVLKRERRGTLFVDSQRKLNFYLRALWGRDFFVRPTSAESEHFKSFIDYHILHLPDAVDDLDLGNGERLSGLELYRATAAHCAAHVAYTRERISAEQLTPAQMFFIGLLEDARVEYLAVHEFPGLKKLWGQILRRDLAPAPHPTVGALENFALMLLDDRVRSPDSELNALAAKFHAEIEARQYDNQLSWHLGLELHNIFASRRDVPSLRQLEWIRIPYRDDNRFVWEFEELSHEDALAYTPASQRQVRRTVHPLVMANELDVETAGDDAQEIWRLETPWYLDQEACTINELEGKEPISDPFHYQEWDYQVQLHRPDWATVYERRQPKGDPALIDDILVEHKPITFRIRQIIDLLQPSGVERVRNMEDGDEIDLNAAIDAMVSIRMGRQPNPRITMRNVIRNRDLAVTILLDLSESTNEKIDGSEKTVLELTREAAALVAMAIEGIGDPFAIHGFASDSRHDVQYYRFKDFEQPMNDHVKSRLAGMRGGLSTRMGAAMRHAAYHLGRRPERRKLLLVVTDGEPADIDERDPQHLRHDTKKAVEELVGRGVYTYCLTLDPHADRYVKRIFGQNNYTIVDRVERLPEQLPQLFASLTS